MSSRSFRRLFVSTLALLGSASVLQAAVPNRIGAISEEGRSALAHTIPARARRASDLGQAPLGRMLSSVTFHFNMSSVQQAALNQLIIDQQNPASPRYHQWLTPAQYGAQFGLSSSDIAKVSAWLTAQGLKVTGVSPSSNFITASGTVAQVQAALGTDIHSLSLDGEQHISNVTDPVLPSALLGIVNGVTGMNDLKLKPRARARKVVVPQFTSSISGSHFIAPGDFYTIYDLSPLLSTSVNGAGITIAVMGQTDISLADDAAFRSASGLSANPPTVRLIGADPGTTNGDVQEAMLDVEWSGAVAPAATILYVNSNDVIGLNSTTQVGSLIYSIVNNVAPILSVSYGACEADWGQANLTTLNAYFQQANVQGQTIVGPAGDSGATDCDYQAFTASDGLAVDFPASSPFVTAAGGTIYNEGSGTYWSTSNGTNAGSANSYIPEAVWNETTSANGLAAGGGGASAYFSKPAWQLGTGVPADFSRDVPDIALSAAASHDGYLYCVQGSCVNGFRASDQTLSVVGGTSISAPSFAGILALVEQKTGGRLGNANPQIYGLANSTYYNNVFHDITTGNNNSPCVQGSQDCPSGGSIGYNAGPGYDLTTGWGTIDAFNMVTKWTLAAAAGTGSPIGSALTQTVLSTSAATCGISGGNLALSIAVQSGSTAPTGFIQILIDGVASGSPIALANGSASYTLNTSALSSGAHNIGAANQRDRNFDGTKGSLITDVVSSTQPDFSITPCTAAASAASGGTAAGITFTVNPFNGFTGPVAFTATAGDATLAYGYQFSVTPVVISGTTSATTVLTLNAFHTNAAAKSGSGSLSQNRPSGMSRPKSVYAAGSGVALAAMMLLTFPRRRRWAALLALIVTAGAIGATGCGSGGSLLNPGNVTPSPTVIPAASGTYTITVIGFGATANGNRVHSTQVSFKVN